MTLDDITRTLQTVAENQAQFTADLGALREQTEKLARSDRLLEEATQLHQQVLRNHEARQTHLDEAFKQVAVSHQMVVELLQIQEERIDGHDESTKNTDARLNALIDS
jgi:hypothetical protein